MKRKRANIQFKKKRKKEKNLLQKKLKLRIQTPKMQVIENKKREQNKKACRKKIIPLNYKKVL